jgi:hypothetical protein
VAGAEAEVLSRLLDAQYDFDGGEA